ncbi:MAG: DUF2079 domain-containing protein [Patescibacteria group bacterium]
MKKFFQIVKFLLGWPISLIALFFISRLFLSQSRNIISDIKDLNLLLLALGLLCFVVFYFVRAFVWKVILKAQGHDIPLKEVSILWAISELKRFAPGKVWGVLGRITAFSQNGISAKTVTKSMFIETAFLLLGSVFVSLLSLPFVFNNLIEISFPLKIFAPQIIGLLSFILILVFIFSNFFSKRILGQGFSLAEKFLPTFSPLVNLEIFITSSLYMALFGVGMYLTVSSVKLLNPENMLILVSFFVLSYLIGFLSFVTPMGLGVREGIVAFGLSKFLTLTTAGFASIYSRVVLILSEFIFVLLSFLWHKTKQIHMEKLQKYISSHKQVLILFTFIVLYITYFTTASFLRHDNFYTGRFDLGNMDQTVWNTIHGRIFQLTNPNGTEIISRLAFHADFLLILLSPLYLIWASAKMLLLTQTIVLGLGAIFVYAIAKDIIKNKNLSLVLGIAFLLNPALQFTNLYDFHPVTLATTFLLGAFYFVRKNKYLWALIFLFFAAISKEEIWLVFGIFGFYMLISAKEKSKKIIGILILILSPIVFYYLVAKAIPSALGQQHFALSYYSEFGGSPIEIIKNILLSPQKIVKIIFQNGQIDYLLKLFAPLGFASIFAPFYLIFALPDLFINLLSNNRQLHEIYYQYSATITPFVFISAIFGIKRIIRIFPKLSLLAISLFILLATLTSSYFFGPLPGAKNPNNLMFIKPQNDKLFIENFLSRIPRKYSIAATNNLGSHLSHRQNIFTIPQGLDKADVIVFLLNDPFAQPSLKEQKQMVVKMKKDKNYSLVLEKDDFVIFKKRNLALK